MSTWFCRIPLLGTRFCYRYRLWYMAEIWIAIHLSCLSLATWLHFHGLEIISYDSLNDHGYFTWTIQAKKTFFSLKSNNRNILFSFIKCEFNMKFHFTKLLSYQWVRLKTCKPVFPKICEQIWKEPHYNS